MPLLRSGQILAALEDLADELDPSEHRQVMKMKGDSEGRWRLRVGEYRVIFKLTLKDEEEAELLISVTDVGTRGGIYG